jgi:hypothetical protein
MGVRHSYRPLRSRFAKDTRRSRTRKEATRPCSGGAAAVIRNVMRSLARWVAITGTLALGMAGCGKAMQIPPQATYTEIQASGVAAKPPDCDIKVLRHEPLTEYRKVGIVEGTGSVYASEADVLPVVKRKACETGADAIIILASKSQTTENLVGYYINAVAIVYGKNPNIPIGPHISH